MDTVTVVFTNGNIVSFMAEEFDVALENRSSDKIAKYSYKNGRGGDSHVYLKPSEVAGIFLTQIDPREREPAIHYTVPGKK